MKMEVGFFINVFVLLCLLTISRTVSNKQPLLFLSIAVHFWGNMFFLELLEIGKKCTIRVFFLSIVNLENILVI